MEVSGKKEAHCSASSLGSDEDFDHRCDLCLTSGQQKEAHGYCKDCKVYLCKVCYTGHQQARETKDHTVLDKKNIDKGSIHRTHSDVCKEKCSIHKDEFVKFFCLQHEKLGCHDCAILHHKTCDLDYIPNKCAGISESEEFTRTAWLLDMRIKAANMVATKAIDRGNEIENYHEALMTRIDKFEKEAIDHIKDIRNKMQCKIQKKKDEDRKIFQGVLDSCSNVSMEISKLQYSLQESKTNKQNGQAYIEIKRAKAKLKSNEITKADEELDITDLQYRFEPNHELQKMLSQVEVFGKLNMTESLAKPLKNLEKVTHEDDVNINTVVDFEKCVITGSAVLPSNKLVLADSSNHKLKLLDIQNKQVNELQLDTVPWDVTKISTNKIAVTLPNKREVLTLTADSKLTPDSTFPVQGWCYGLTHYQDYLYVVCQNPNSVVILDTNGIRHNTISLHSDVFINPRYIVVGWDTGVIYISDWISKSIVSLTAEGEIVNVIKDQPTPLGMKEIPGGSLLVCCENGMLQQVTKDLLQCRQMTDSLPSPWSVAINHQLQEVYIGCGHDNLKVYSLKY